MPRRYEHVGKFEREILELKSQGKTHQEIAEHLGFRKEQITCFFVRYNKKQRRIAAGEVIGKRGHPGKRPIVTSNTQLSELKEILAKQQKKIKRLEMETELLQNFLALVEGE